MKEFAQRPDISFGKSKQLVSRLLAEFMDTVDSQLDIFSLPGFSTIGTGKEKQKRQDPLRLS